MAAAVESLNTKLVRAKSKVLREVVVVSQNTSGTSL